SSLLLCHTNSERQVVFLVVERRGALGRGRGVRHRLYGPFPLPTVLPRPRRQIALIAHALRCRRRRIVPILARDLPRPVADEHLRIHAVLVARLADGARPKRPRGPRLVVLDEESRSDRRDGRRRRIAKRVLVRLDELVRRHERPPVFVGARRLPVVAPIAVPVTILAGVGRARAHLVAPQGRFVGRLLPPGPDRRSVQRPEFDLLLARGTFRANPDRYVLRRGVEHRPDLVVLDLVLAARRLAADDERRVGALVLVLAVQRPGVPAEQPDTDASALGRLARLPEIGMVDRLPVVTENRHLYLPTLATFTYGTFCTFGSTT